MSDAPELESVLTHGQVAMLVIEAMAAPDQKTIDDAAFLAMQFPTFVDTEGVNMARDLSIASRDDVLVRREAANARIAVIGSTLGYCALDTELDETNLWALSVNSRMSVIVNQPKRGERINQANRAALRDLVMEPLWGADDPVVVERGKSIIKVLKAPVGRGSVVASIPRFKRR